MSFCNRILAGIAVTLVFSAPAFADGTPGKTVNRGPVPVQAHEPAPCPRQPNPCGTITRTYVKKHPPVITKRTPPPTRTVVQRKVETSTEVSLDMASFSGGVGNGVDGGFYGGGGAVFISSGRSFSGVLSHSASSFTFRSRRRGGKKRRYGGGGGCGCMGGMGGGD